MIWFGWLYDGSCFDFRCLVWWLGLFIAVDLGMLLYLQVLGLIALGFFNG